MKESREIYRILKVLEASLDHEELDPDRIAPEALGLSRIKRDNLLAMLSEEGLVKGVVVRRHTDKAGRTILVDPSRLEITCKGLAFLEENSMMQKAANAAKGIIDIIS